MKDATTIALLLCSTLLSACAASPGRSGSDDDDDDDEDGAVTGSAGGDTFGGSSSGSVGSSGTTGEPPPPPPPACTYPQGPYGNHLGETLPPSLAWPGFSEGSTAQGTVSITDYFDCDGSQGIHGLLLIASTEFCPVCQQEAATLEGLTSGPWKAAGIHVVSLLMQDGAGQPATINTAQKWKSAFGLSTSAVAADPDFSLAIGGTTGTPLEVTVDPRTMKIVHRQEGYSGQHPQLEQLAASNAP